MFTLFTSNTCPNCKSLKIWLANKNIDYDEANVSTDFKAKALLLSFGVMSVPSALINEHIIVGIDRIKDLLEVPKE
jgi:glutaredoxin